MSSLATIRTKHGSRTRRIFGLLFALWLNMALQPCVMAFEEAADHNCPHCPTEQENTAASHHHAHGETADSRPCVSLESPCSIADDVNHDGRSGTLKLKDIQVQLPVLIGTDVYEHPATHVVEPDRLTEPLVRPGTSPPLNVLFCVYLD